MKKFWLAAIILQVFSIAPAHAEGAVSGKIQYLLSYQLHSGLLVKLSTAMPDPDGCGRTDWYILPDNSPRATLMQSMLLTAQSAVSDVTLTVNGCVEGIPKIVHVMK